MLNSKARAFLRGTVRGLLIGGAVLGAAWLGVELDQRNHERHQAELKQRVERLEAFLRLQVEQARAMDEIPHCETEWMPIHGGEGDE